MCNFKVHWTLGRLTRRTARVGGPGTGRLQRAHEDRLTPERCGTQFDYRNEFKAPVGPLGAAASRVVMGGVPEREAKRRWSS